MVRKGDHAKLAKATSEANELVELFELQAVSNISVQELTADLKVV